MANGRYGQGGGGDLDCKRLDASAKGAVEARMILSYISTDYGFRHRHFFFTVLEGQSSLEHNAFQIMV